MKRKIVGILVLTIIIFSSCTYSFAASTTELNDQKQDVTQQKQDAQNELKEVKGQLSENLKSVQELEEAIETTQNEINGLNTEIKDLQNEIAEKEKEIEQKEEEFAETDELLRQRLVAMYQAGETSYLDVLFSSEGLTDFISKYYYLTQIAKCDTELMEKIDREKTDIVNEKAKIQKNKEKIESNKRDIQSKQNRLKTDKAAKETKVAKLNQDEKTLKKEIDEANAKLAKIEKEIEEELKRIEEEMNKNGGTSGIHFDGSFVWPCNNKTVTSTVKNRWGRKHKGIDIAARYENVYATASGYAYTRENPGGYGHYIIVIHGNNYISLYGHLNSYKVSSGQFVKQGQVIAQSGNSGASTGAHLHFELRRASTISSFFKVAPLNPLEYLPGGYTLTPGATKES